MGAAAVKKKATHHKTAASAHNAHKKKPPAGRSKAPAARKNPSRTVRRVPARSWRTAQSAPTPDRYKEIQQALAEKGYLHAEPSGKWDPESGDALRRFQKDQHLESSGKLDSLSLIALGLGPKHEATAAAPPAAQP